MCSSVVLEKSNPGLVRALGAALSTFGVPFEMILESYDIVCRRFPFLGSNERHGDWSRIPGRGRAWSLAPKDRTGDP